MGVSQLLGSAIGMKFDSFPFIAMHLNSRVIVTHYNSFSWSQREEAEAEDALKVALLSTCCLIEALCDFQLI
jgi:hypothetical protein